MTDADALARAIQELDAAIRRRRRFRIRTADLESALERLNFLREEILDETEQLGLLPPTLHLLLRHIKNNHAAALGACRDLNDSLRRRLEECDVQRAALKRRLVQANGGDDEKFPD